MRVLVVKISSLGDVIQTLPVLHDMRVHEAGITIDWVVEEAFAPLLQVVQGIETIIPIAQRRWRLRPFAPDTVEQKRRFRDAIRQHPYDAVIDFQGLVKSALVARQARLTRQGHRYTYANASELCGYEWPVRYMVDRPVPMDRRVHAVRRYRLLAARSLGYELDDLRWRVDWTFAPPEASSNDVLLAHGTTRADNEWPEASWAEIGRRLVAQGFRIVLPQSGAIEQLRVERIAALIGPGVELLPPMKLDALARRMAACRAVIGVDSGLSHLAVALDLPHVQIFSQPRAWRAGPVGREHQLPVGGDHTPQPDEVWATWERAWGQRPGRA